jgi:hypothetical protein
MGNAAQRHWRTSGHHRECVLQRYPCNSHLVALTR